MPYFEIDTQSGVLGIQTHNDNVILNAHRGRDVNLVIPDSITFPGTNDKLTINAIGKKAFLSDKYLYRLDIPESVKKVGDWAFAGCRSLAQISLHRDILLENGVFKDCESLREVIISDEEDAIFETFADKNKAREDIGFLLAAVITLLDDKYLFDLGEVGKSEWIESWDRKMDTILSEPDDEGFVALLACGEEDYEGKDNTLESYLSRRRMRKVRICFLRLLHDTNLSTQRRDKLKKYLYDHRAGARFMEEKMDNGVFTDDGHMGRMYVKKKNEYDDNYGATNTEVVSISEIKNKKYVLQDETWQVTLNEHGDEEEYYQLMFDCGCINKDNLDIMLEDMGERHARMKAFLLRLNSGGASEGFFSDLDL